MMSRNNFNLYRIDLYRNDFVSKRPNSVQTHDLFSIKVWIFCIHQFMYESSTKTPQSACFKRLGLGFTLVVRYCEVILWKMLPPTAHRSVGVFNDYNCKSLTFDLALGNSWSIGRSLKDKGTLSGCLFTENDSHMALCKGFCVMLSPIRATRPRERVASSLGNSLAAAMLDCREIRVSCRTNRN